MSAMADLDIKLSEFKLSDAQKNGVLELMEGPFKLTKANTIKSLEKKDIIKADKSVEGGWQFTDVFVTKSGIFGEQPDGLDREAVKEINQVDEIVTLLDSSPWDKSPETYSSDFAAWEAELLGFGETLKWKNTKVWDGLTAAEIREDMDTARPSGRAARRSDAKLVRKLRKSLVIV